MNLRRLHGRRRHDAARPPPPHAAERCKATIKWALFGFTGYSLFLSVALTCDMTKLTVGSFGAQLALELFAGLTFGLAFLSLQLGLLIALLRYRLYDAEVVISRSVNVALITLGVAAVFAATAGCPEAVRLQLLWQQRRRGSGYFRRGAFDDPGQPHPGTDHALVREPLPAELGDPSRRAPRQRPRPARNRQPWRIDRRCSRTRHQGRNDHARGGIIDQGVFRTRGISKEKVEEWRDQTADWTTEDCVVRDKTFPLRVPLRPGDAEQPLGYLLVGPRPDNSLPSKDEQKALREVAESIARAIRTVIKRVAYERRLELLIEFEHPPPQ